MASDDKWPVSMEYMRQLQAQNVQLLRERDEARAELETFKLNMVSDEEYAKLYDECHELKALMLEVWESELLEGATLDKRVYKVVKHLREKGGKA